MSLRLLLLIFLITLFVPPSVRSQAVTGGAWSENTNWLQGDYEAYAGLGTYFTEDIAIRGGQMPLKFTMGSNCFWWVQVRVIAPYAGSWQTIHDSREIGCPTGSVVWPGVPTSAGECRIEMKYMGLSGSWHSFTYDLIVVPAAQRAFSDGLGNSMVYWQGTTLAMDKPLLVVEGIDASDMHYESAYYALGADLFGQGRQRGADVLILNFADGGADMRANAGVVEDAILYLNQIKTGSRKLDVAGVSMGGVVARYALADMEDRSVVHNIGRFVSIDAPQQGAVLDLDLQEWIYYSERHLVPVPDNLSSMAGKQLLKEDLFDLYTPSQHDLFYAELNALNGDGYPHQTIENVGVSFGTPSSNPHTGQEWLTVHLPIVLDPHFYVEAGTPEAVAGSWLPEEVTDLWGKALSGFADWEFDRLADPTFIPYDSALDRVSGVSQFDYTLDAEFTRHHNVFPDEIVEPLLARLGYPPPPLSVSINGPSTVPPATMSTWTANRSGGVSPYTYLWEHKYTCTGGGGDPWLTGEGEDGTRRAASAGRGPGTLLPPCGVWESVGTAYSLTQSFSPGTGTLRLTVTDDVGTVKSATKTVTVSSSAVAGGPEDAAKGGDDPETAGAGAQAAGRIGLPAGLPPALALEGAHPNPFNPRTVLRYALPEAGAVRLSVYDALGREVARLVDGRAEVGHHEARFDASALPSGVYLVRLVAGAQVETMRVTLLK